MRPSTLRPATVRPLTPYPGTPGSSTRDPDGSASVPEPLPELKSSAAIAGSGLLKRFGDRVAVDNIDISVAPGEVVGLLGGNGAGKTTTFRMLAGVLVPDEGEVVVGGATLGPRSAELRAAIGLVPQSIALYPYLTVRENLRLFGRMYGVPRRELRERISQLLEVLDLSDRRDDSVFRLSGGMARRLNLAAGLLHRPQVLLLDEPVVGVDPQSRVAIFELIREVAADGVAVLYTSHQLDEAQRLCDRFVILDNGRVVAAGGLSDLRRAADGTATLRVRMASVADACRVEAELVRDCSVLSIHRNGELLDLEVDDPSARLGEVVASIGLGIQMIELHGDSLEQMYLELTSPS